MAKLCIVFICLGLTALFLVTIQADPVVNAPAIAADAEDLDTADTFGYGYYAAAPWPVYSGRTYGWGGWKYGGYGYNGYAGVSKGYGLYYRRRPIYPVFG